MTRLRCYACLRSGPSKGARYEIDASIPVAQAANWCMTSQHGYMLYSVGGVLYGYDFRNGRKPVQLLDFSPAEITQIHGDIHTVAEGNSGLNDVRNIAPSIRYAKAAGMCIRK